MAIIQSGDDLNKVQIKSADRTQKPLVPSTVSSDNRDTAAKSLVLLLRVKGSLPRDGSVHTSPPPSTNGIPNPESPIRTSLALPCWGASFDKTGFQFHKGDTAIHQLSKSQTIEAQVANPMALSSNNAIDVLAGDFFNWLKKTLEAVENSVVQEVEGAYYFFASIAGKIYRLMLDYASAVMTAIEFVNQIKVFFDDLIAWLSFLFDWDDIVRTHKVMKNMMKLHAGRVVNEIASLETSIDNFFVTLEDKINSWAGITEPGESIGTMQHCASTLASGNSPQYNWAVYRTQNGIGYADTPFGQPDVPPDILTQLLQELSDIVEQEGDYFKATFTQIKEQVADQFPLLTPTQVIQRIMGIVADLVTKTARNFIDKLLDVIKIVITGLLDLLDAPLNIPILSPLYKLIAGSDLTFLDLFCLIGAIPATIVYKFIASETPRCIDDGAVFL